MVSYGKKLNKNDVRNGILRFLVSLIILISVSFLSLFLFFKSSYVQNVTVKDKLEEYKRMINKTEQLQSKIDNIYDDMLLLSTNKVGNDIYLSSKIMSEIRDCRNIIGKDSVVEFKQHMHLLKNIEKKMMPIKNDLIIITVKEQSEERRLKDCTSKVIQAKANNIPNLVRNFGK